MPLGNYLVNQHTSLIVTSKDGICCLRQLIMTTTPVAKSWIRACVCVSACACACVCVCDRVHVHQVYATNIDRYMYFFQDNTVMLCVMSGSLHVCLEYLLNRLAISWCSLHRVRPCSLVIIIEVRLKWTFLELA